ncbi:unnamed protein product [Cylicocyclus nassatus]|uniref:Uncharacterized protein n=1 Tax=Cylicocyclus nassatus TaxID=53992 RepID=A0AA36GVU4_CYLNA|nr:unnamed protein product [Cylicocyclus nassatus]
MLAILEVAINPINPPEDAYRETGPPAYDRRYMEDVAVVPPVAQEESIQYLLCRCFRIAVLCQPLIAPILEFLRILARDKSSLDLLLIESRLFIIRASGLDSTSSSVVLKGLDR